jgi:DNA polymerase III delta subunit
MARERAAAVPVAERLARLERDDPGGLVLVHGQETYLAERAVATCRRRFAGLGEWRVVWGDDEPERVRAALEAMTSRGLFGGGTSVVIRRADAMRGAVEAAVEGIVEDDRYEGRLVLVATGLDRRKRWCAAAARRAFEIHCAPLVDAREVRSWVVRMAGERDARIADDAAAELVERCGLDLALLDAEVEKLVLAAPGTPIDRALVRRLVASVRGWAVEELTDRLARRDVAGVVRVLRGLLDDGEPPLRLVAFLAANLRRALHVVDLKERGCSPTEIASRIGLPDWLVRRQLDRGPSARLERALATLAALDVALKSSRPEELVFEAALRELAGASAR